MSLTNGWQSYISTSFPTALTVFNTSTPASTITNVPIVDLFLATAVTPDGTRIYLANRTVASVSVLDPSTFALLATIPTAAAGATDIIPAPAPFQRVYVSNSVTGTLTIISTQTNTVLNTIALEGQLARMAITPDGSRLFVGQTVGGLVIVLNALSNPSSPSVLTSISVGANPGSIAITPDGTFAYVTSRGASQLTIINIATLAFTTLTLTPGSGPYGSSILPNGSLLFVTNTNNSTISVLNLLNKSSPQVVATINFDPSISPYWAVSTPDSKTVFVIDENVPAHVIPIDVKTLLPGTPITTSGIYQDITMSPDLSPVAHFTFTKSEDEKNRTVIVRFDASLSSSPVGTIVQYNWNFGDGDTFITSTPLIDHIYQKNRHSVVVTLVVTNSAGTSTSQVWSSRLMSNFGSSVAQRSKLLILRKEKHHHCCYCD